MTLLLMGTSAPAHSYSFLTHELLVDLVWSDSIRPLLLARYPGLYSNTHLLCASFDPDNDTPARLRAYAQTYIGSDPEKSFAHWDFAVPGKSTLPAMAHYFDVGLTTESDQTITHTLSTTLVGPDGKVIRFYNGNQWTPEQVLADLAKLYPQNASWKAAA